MKSLLLLFFSSTLWAQVKIAVLDNGFEGFKNEVGRNLPSSTFYHEAKNRDSHGFGDHGLAIAKILSSQVRPPYELHLYPTFGYSNFSAAVDDVIKNKMDIVLYAQVWEYGGNHDGQGFINALVSKATNAGILWINAAGNFGLSTYNSPIETDDKNWVKFPDNGVMIQCFEDSSCPLRAVLTWNDFKNDVNRGSNIDLDLLLLDDKFEKIAASELIQKRNSKNESGVSIYPREIIEIDLNPGIYYLRARAKSKNFAGHQLRITVSGEGIAMIHPSLDESLLNPADNADVITVGACDSPTSSKSLRLRKPDIVNISRIQLESGEFFEGSSAAAALVAGVAVNFKQNYPSLNRSQLLNLMANQMKSMDYIKPWSWSWRSDFSLIRSCSSPR